ncbi:MAG: NUDIX hydrolase [Pseudomonadales bacterium]|jgi:8-oxo-dGTP diphosphatase|nr:NUDIX hydrolase [Pseudomonadales bacterium]MDP6470119.1 NUDIX hydrolase [Pseudomonadales bacterium]MDP6827022.1 NUDIX hydrolase [Pseudomonadales bacterium]MDP6972080.1 NUDIX hydrolase [Pseudomonadales bacterium]|tara:strand:- start:2946 stop:3365 length:420 start_codon:yes stop_codon:yes gene_type:complete
MHNRYRTARGVIVRDKVVLLAIHSSFWGAKHQRWGLPGGRIEWRETPEVALVRELREELDLHLAEEDLLDIGAFHYKRALHKLFTTRIEHDIGEYDDSELLDLGWFSASDVQRMSDQGKLHAGYEFEALTRAFRELGNT